MELLAEGFVNILDWKVILFLVIGVMVGIAIGSLPGLTSTMGVALMLPLTFGLDPVTGILLLLGVYFGSVYGGSITAILINTPGTPAAAATVIDGYPLAQKGMGQKALTVSIFSAFIGGIISVLILIFVSPYLAEFALKFSAPESFALALFGLSIVSSIAGGSLVKGLFAGVLGLIIATIGLDPIGGFPRFTFGSSELSSGIDFIPIMIGLFAASEAFKSMEDIFSGENIKLTVHKARLKWSEFKAIIGTILRSSGIGSFIGMIPGAGADIAAFVSYNEAKRFAKNKEEFGKGDLRGIAAPEAAGNSVTGGAMIPLLTLGIPGDAVTAVLLGALMVQGIQPGPMLFETNGSLVYTLFIGMLFANIIMLIFGLTAIKLFIKLLSISKSILTPIIIVLCTVGAYALNNSYFDVVVMFIAGVVGYFLKKADIPASPIILGLILGPMLESNLRRSLVMSQGDLSIFYTRPITLVLLALAFLTIFLPTVIGKIKNNKKETTT